MVLYRELRQIQAICNFLVCQLLEKQLNEFVLAAGEIVFRFEGRRDAGLKSLPENMLKQSEAKTGRANSFALSHAANSCDDIRSRRILQEIRGHACTYRLEEDFTIFTHPKQYNFQRALLRLPWGERIHPHSTKHLEGIN